MALWRVLCSGVQGARARFPPAMLRRGQLTYEHKLQVICVSVSVGCYWSLPPSCIVPALSVLTLAIVAHLQVPTEAAWERRYLEWGHAQG